MFRFRTQFLQIDKCFQFVKNALKSDLVCSFRFFPGKLRTKNSYLLLLIMSFCDYTFQNGNFTKIFELLNDFWRLILFQYSFHALFGGILLIFGFWSIIYFKAEYFLSIRKLSCLKLNPILLYIYIFLNPKQNPNNILQKCAHQVSKTKAMFFS